MGITIATFEKNSDYATAGGVWQWSYGQILRIQGLDLPPAVEIHFSMQKTGADCKTRDGVTKDGVTDVQIPNSMLENDGATQDYDVYAFVYLTDETSGQTVKYIRIPIYARSKPEAFEKPEDAELFRKAIAAVNESADRAETALAGAETARDEAQATADGIREDVQGMVDEANAAKNTAIEYANISTNNAERAEVAMSATETTLNEVNTAAENVITYMQNATDEVNTAKNIAAESANIASGNAEKTETDREEVEQNTASAKAYMEKAVEEAGNAKTYADQARELVESMPEWSLEAAPDVTLEQEGKAADSKVVGDKINELKSDLIANANADAKTDRSLDALWKLNQGISYQFETDETKAYQKDVPSGAKLASVKQIGGKTVVWNQKFDLMSTKITSFDGSAKILDNTLVYKCSGNVLNNRNVIQLFENNTNDSHMYYVSTKATNNSEQSIGIKWNINNDDTMSFMTFNPNESAYLRYISVYSRVYGMRLIRNNECKSTDELIFEDINVFDLTKMFGAGNEPSTVEEFEAMFPDDYYEYNLGELLSSDIESIIVNGSNMCPGWGAEFDIEAGSYFVSSAESPESTRADFMFLDYDGNAVTDGISVSRAYINGKIFRISADMTKLSSNITIENKSVRKMKVFGTYSSYIPHLDLMVVRGDTSIPFAPYKNPSIYPIPQSILDLDGYGDSVSDEVYNYVDWENKKYHKRVGSVDLGTLVYLYDLESVSVPTFKAPIKEKKLGAFGCLCSKYEYVGARNGLAARVGIAYRNDTTNVIHIRDDSFTDVESFTQAMLGVMLYYELAKEEIIDISDILTDDVLANMEVEAGGSLTFKNSNGDGYRIPVSNTEEYIISLAEVSV